MVREKEKNKGMFFELDYGKNIKLDLRDKKILSILGKNCRTTIATIAKSAYASKDSIRYRIKQLIEKDIYRGNITIINPFILGFPIYSILIKIKSITPEKEDKLIEFFKKHPFIIWIGQTQGSYDLNIIIATKDVTHFDSLLKEIQLKLTNNVKDLKVLHFTKMYSYNTLPLEFQQESDVKIQRGKIDSSFSALLSEPTASTQEEKLSLKMKEILILKEIANNANLSLQEIYEKTKIKPDTVKNIIKNLINKKIILAFRALINVSFLKYHGYIIYLKFSPETKEKQRKEFEEYFKNSVYTSFGAEASGSYYDSAIYVFAKNPIEFNKLINDVRNRFSNTIEDIDSDLILKDYKFTFFPKGLLSPIQNILVRLGSKFP